MPRRRIPERLVHLDRSLDALPLFRLSDSVEEGAVHFVGDDGARWRVIAAPGERLPGTFDQDVYLELCRRYLELGAPADGVFTFTLHAFLRAMGRRVDGRTYEQLRGALARLERTLLESFGAYHVMKDGAPVPFDGRFSLLTSVVIERRRTADREQLTLFESLPGGEPGEARVTLAAPLRANLRDGHVTTLTLARWLALGSPVARRLYRLLGALRAAEGESPARLVRFALPRLAERLPLTQRYPSHLQRVLQPAHDALLAGGVLDRAEIRQEGREWIVEYALGANEAADPAEFRTA